MDDTQHGGARPPGPSGDEAEPGAAGEIQAPRGTMALVLVYIAATVVLWAYMYFILMHSEGVVGTVYGEM